MSQPANDSFAAKLAYGMQHKTRKQQGFEETERQMPTVRPERESLLGQLNVSSLLSHLGSFNPMPKPVVPGDIVWMFDNVAFRPSRLGSWQAEFTMAVFENEPKCSIVNVVEFIARTIGLTDESDGPLRAQQMQIIESRLLPFLWDLRRGRQITARQKDRQLKLGPTDSGGVSHNLLKVPKSPPGTIVRTTADLPEGVWGIKESSTYFAEPEGWSIVSDIDDTIKITMTSDPIGIIRETFLNEPKPIPGMQALYTYLQGILPADTPWFYLSASPYNLYPFLRNFRNQFNFPPGAIMLRDASWKTLAGLLLALTQATEEYKEDRLRKIHGWFPKRKMILIGDSTQSDPEAYGEIYRAFPGWVKFILIRKALDIAAVGIQEKNAPERFQKAFKDVPREAWSTFEHPQECEKMLHDVIRRG